MKWAVIILMLAVALSLAAMLFYFIVEGFRITQAEADARMGPTADKVCKDYKGCAYCVDDTKHRQILLKMSKTIVSCFSITISLSSFTYSSDPIKKFVS